MILFADIENATTKIRTSSLLMLLWMILILKFKSRKVREYGEVDVSCNGEYKMLKARCHVWEAMQKAYL